MSSDADDPLQWYLRQVSTIAPLAKEEEAELFRQVRAGDDLAESAGRRIIEANLSLVVTIAERYRPSGLPMLDLAQEGNVGLLKAMKTFTGTSGESFSAHAATCIEEALQKAIAVRRSSSGGKS